MLQDIAAQIKHVNHLNKAPWFERTKSHCLLSAPYNLRFKIAVYHYWAIVTFSAILRLTYGIISTSSKYKIIPDMQKSVGFDKSKNARSKINRSRLNKKNWFTNSNARFKITNTSVCTEWSKGKEGQRLHPRAWVRCRWCRLCVELQVLGNNVPWHGHHSQQITY